MFDRSDHAVPIMLERGEYADWSEHVSMLLFLVMWE